MKIEISLEDNSEIIEVLTEQILQRIEEQSTKFSSVNDLPRFCCKVF